MTSTAFILSYNGIDELASWFDPKEFKNTNIYIIDNGRQIIPDKLKPYVIHTTEQNIFCAGGWNLACKLGFRYMQKDSIVITQDDLKFTEQNILDAIDYCNPKTIVGGRSDYFFYAFFAIHSNTYEKVGEFDENFLFVTCEDNDYHYRSLLHGIGHVTLNATMSNLHLTSKDMSWKYGNHEYLIDKWGKEKSWGVYSYTEPFNGMYRPIFRKEYWNYFSDIKNIFMSEFEYNKFIYNNKFIHR